MSYQAYLDAIETRTGKTPDALLTQARARGYDATTKAGVVTTWLAEDYGLGRGHAMAFYGVLKNGPIISAKHINSTGSHRDESTVLRLDGIARR